MSHEVNESVGARAWLTGWGSSAVAVAITEVHEIFLVSMLSLFVISLVLLSLESGVSLEASDVSLVIFVSIEVHEVSLVSMLSLEVHEVSLVFNFSLLFILEVIMIVISIEENDEVFFIIRFDGSTGRFDGTSGVGGTFRHILEGLT